MIKSRYLQFRREQNVAFIPNSNKTDFLLFYHVVHHNDNTVCYCDVDAGRDPGNVVYAKEFFAPHDRRKITKKCSRESSRSIT